jgi:hypothetical protein
MAVLQLYAAWKDVPPPMLLLMLLSWCRFVENPVLQYSCIVHAGLKL